jgi:hypothetical protein
MYETLNLKSEYTGERYYDEEQEVDEPEVDEKEVKESPRNPSRPLPAFISKEKNSSDSSDSKNCKFLRLFLNRYIIPSYLAKFTEVIDDTVIHSVMTCKNHLDNPTEALRLICGLYLTPCSTFNLKKFTEEHLREFVKLCDNDGLKFSERSP